MKTMMKSDDGSHQRCSFAEIDGFCSLQNALTNNNNHRRQHIYVVRLFCECLSRLFVFQRRRPSFCYTKLKPRLNMAIENKDQTRSTTIYDNFGIFLRLLCHRFGFDGVSAIV